MRTFMIYLVLLGAVIVGSNRVLYASEPIIIAHRGASGYRPEHTLGAYKLAIDQGADFIEPDLVMTKDGHFVARHDIYLSETTDIASHPEFETRKRTIKNKTDWFVFDFTLAELKTLRAIQPRSNRGTEFDGVETIPTLLEIVDLVREKANHGQKVGLYVELKRPDIFMGMSDNFEEMFVRSLQRIHDENIPLIFQCFSTDFTMSFSSQTDIPTILLVEGIKNDVTGWYEPEVSIEPYLGKVWGFGLDKALLVTKDGHPSGVIEKIHAAGGVVHVWTIRNDQVPKMFNQVEDELKVLFAMGVDGIFADYPDTAVTVRDNAVAYGKGF